MANGKNYAKQISKPSEKLDMGEYSGKIRHLREEFDLAGNEAVNDEILGPSLPKGARVIDAYVKVDKSTGATGIFILGHKASLNEDGSALAEDDDAFVSNADAGGQAVFAKPAAGNIGMDKKFGQSETQIFAKVTEVLPGTVSDAVLSFGVSYIID